MIDAPISDEGRDLADGDQHDRKFLAGVGPGLGDPPGISDDDRGDGHRQERGVRAERAQRFARIPGVASLLQQLAGPGLARVLARFEQAAGRLEAVAPRPRRGTG